MPKTQLHIFLSNLLFPPQFPVSADGIAWPSILEAGAFGLILYSSLSTSGRYLGLADSASATSSGAVCPFLFSWPCRSSGSVTSFQAAGVVSRRLPQEAGSLPFHLPF